MKNIQFKLFKVISLSYSKKISEVEQYSKLVLMEKIFNLNQLLPSYLKVPTHLSGIAHESMLFGAYV